MPTRLADADLRLVDWLVVPASLHDVEGRFIYVNAAAEQAAGKSNAELLGRLYTELLPPEVREHVRAQFRRAVEDGEPTDFETAFVDGGGHLRGVRAQQLPLRDGEEIVGVLILAFEVVRGAPPAPLLIRPPHLTPRQREVLELLAEGLSTVEIASRLAISSETARNHLRSAFRELGAHSRVEAIATVQRLGLLAAPVLRPQARGQRGPYGA
jgi:PAS domain S-box-containing protein